MQIAKEEKQNLWRVFKFLHIKSFGVCCLSFAMYNLNK